MKNQRLMMVARTFSPEELFTKVIHGDYNLNPKDYYEEFDVSKFNIESLISVNINGLNYSNDNSSFYNPVNKKIYINYFKTSVFDNISILFNIISPENLSLKGVSTEYDLFSKKIENYNEMTTRQTEEKYTEVFDLSDLEFHNFVGIDINSLFYCDNSIVSYNKIEKRLYLKGLEILHNYDTCIIFNVLK